MDGPAYVNGQTFVEGFGAFIIIFLIVCAAGWLISKRVREYEDRGYYPSEEDDAEFFQKIEDLRHDFD